MESPEPVSVTTLELYRQGARLESKLDRLDEKLDGHAQEIVLLKHRVAATERELVRATEGRRWGVGTALTVLSVLVAAAALIVGLYAITKGVR